MNKIHSANQESTEPIVFNEFNGKCLPFVLNEKTSLYVKFNYIPISGENIKTVDNIIDELNAILEPYKKYIGKSFLTKKYERGSTILADHYSNIRVGLTTPSGKEAKYPTCLVLGYWNANHGSEGVSFIYFLKNGDIGKAELARIVGEKSYQVKMKIIDGSLQVRRIDKTLYEEPYGTKTLYIRE